MATNGYAIGCDLDGTLCDTQWREVHAQRRDWNAFHAGMVQDSPSAAVLLVVRSFISHGVPVVYFTGRPERYRAATTEWLEHHFVDSAHLYMRPDEDKRTDAELKAAQYQQFKDACPDLVLMFVMEDRDRVVAMWRDLGVPCFQVRPGAY
jgi:hypothetical protein